MSSTDLTLDEQDIHFLLKDWLNVSRLAQYDSFKDYDQETIEMLVEEGLRFATDVVAPPEQKVIATVAEWKMGGSLPRNV